MSDLKPDVALYARAYLGAGLSIFPLDPASKRPLGAERDRAMRWQPYQKGRASGVEADSWFRPFADGRVPNIAIVGGTVSGNLAIVDFDSPLAWEQFRDQVPDILSRTKIVRSGREPAGYHVYMRLPESTKKGYAIVPGEFDEHGQPVRLGVDLQGEGSYVVAPPSIHPSGRRYSWINPEVKRIGHFTTEELQGIAGKLGGAWTWEGGRSAAGASPTSPQRHPRNWIGSLLLAAPSMHDGDGRNRSLLSLMGYFRSRVPFDIGYAIAELWNSQLAGPMEASEVQTIVTSGYRYGESESDTEEQQDYESLEV